MSEKGFEQIISWQKARILNKEIYSLTKKQNFSKDFALRDQIRRRQFLFHLILLKVLEENPIKSLFIF